MCGGVKLVTVPCKGLDVSVCDAVMGLLFNSLLLGLILIAYS